MTTRTVLSVLLCYLGALLPGSANLVISEIDLANSKVELVNTGDAITINIGPYWLCNRVSGNPNYLRLSNLTIDTDNSTATNLRIEPGQLVVLEVPGAFLPEAGAELGLYSSNAFGTRAAMVDYINYGNSTGVRDFTATLDPAIWVLDTAIDVSGAGPRDTIQLNLGAPGNEVADYSVKRSSLGWPQSVSVPLIGDIVISELDLANSTVELANLGNAEVDLAGYVWNNAATGGPTPSRQVTLADLDPANSTNNSLQVPPGGVATFNLDAPAPFLPPAGGELGLYNTDNDFNSRDALVDYLAYGNSLGVRDVVAVLDPVIWVLNTSIDLSGANPGDTIQLNPGEPGEEVAHYSLAPPTIGEAQSIILPTLRITDLGFVDSDTCFIDFEYSGTRALKVTEAADLITFTDVSARTAVASPSTTRFEFDVTGDQLYFRLEED